ncbi:GtrA family protein [Pseudomonas sp. Ant30-3]|uniref:GtrA family protein n=1 Tax=Pseudomonas sp. Ant30-3 TaxID=1488328 RepID=UPI00067BBD7F|nr:GtrA family protein [Pseudomonas sp. Ant30-3]
MTLKNNGLLKRLTGFSFARFLVSGGVNTVLTYGAYLLLLKMFSYKIAYTISYLAGILLAFTLNRYFVFKSHQGAKSALLFPFIYVIQYVLSIVIIWAWVEKFGLNIAAAPLISIILTIPVTFILSRMLFATKK